MSPTLSIVSTSWSPHSTTPPSQRIERVVWIHRILAIGMALLLIFTIIWLRARLLRPWKQLLSMARAVSQRDFTQRAHISGRNEMATLGMALNNMSEELAESYAVLERRVQEKTAGLEQKNEILAFLWQANRRLHSSAPALRTHFAGTEWPAGADAAARYRGTGLRPGRRR
ncbi:nitrate/nitrite sensor protein [Klebsiella pneumoniae subsp. rhinoscleromatis]|nr:nitrate/nitrite sensor protein [Klebsiella pneumoniae subsp. rhinoscleromatis]